MSVKVCYILQFYLDKGANTAQAYRESCAVPGQSTLPKATAKGWFKRFRSGNFDVEDAPFTGGPMIEKVDRILAKVKQDRHISSHDIDKELS